MAIVITNGMYYVAYNEYGGIIKTNNMDEAFHFQTVDDAVQSVIKAKGKTRKYYVYDTETDYILWRWWARDKKPKRKHYSEDARMMVYLKAGCRCELCGKKLLFEDMTLDHIVPLSMGGADKITNVACTCKPCNQFKSNILPENFMDKINSIFMYQMEKQAKHRLKWKVVQKLLLSMCSK